MKEKPIKWITLKHKLRIPVYEGQSIGDAIKNNIKSKIKPKKHVNKRISVKLDTITNCLKDKKTGQELETSTDKINISIKMQLELKKTRMEIQLE